MTDTLTNIVKTHQNRIIESIFTMADLAETLEPTSPHEEQPIVDLRAAINFLKSQLLTMSPYAQARYLAWNNIQGTSLRNYLRSTAQATVSSSRSDIEEVPLEFFSASTETDAGPLEFFSASTDADAGPPLSGPPVEPVQPAELYPETGALTFPPPSMRTDDTAAMDADTSQAVVTDPQDRLAAAERPDALIVGSPSTTFWVLYGTALALAVVGLAGTIWLMAQRVNEYTITLLVLTCVAIVFVATILGLRGKVKIALSATAAAVLAATVGVSIYYTVKLPEAGPIFTTVALGLTFLMLLTALIAIVAYDV